MIKKLIAFALMICGFLILAYGYRYDAFMTGVGGALLIAVGLVLLVMSIARRNRDVA